MNGNYGYCNENDPMEYSIIIRCSNICTHGWTYKKFYKPLLFRPFGVSIPDGTLYSMFDSEDMPFVWGWETYEEAFNAANEKLQKEIEKHFAIKDETYSKSKSVDQEDFHPDGFN